MLFHSIRRKFVSRALYNLLHEPDTWTNCPSTHFRFHYLDNKTIIDHQYHNDFLTPAYGKEYNDLVNAALDDGRIKITGCPDRVWEWGYLHVSILQTNAIWREALICTSSCIIQLTSLWQERIEKAYADGFIHWTTCWNRISGDNGHCILWTFLLHPLVKKTTECCVCANRDLARLSELKHRFNVSIGAYQHYHRLSSLLISWGKCWSSDVSRSTKSRSSRNSHTILHVAGGCVKALHVDVAFHVVAALSLPAKSFSMLGGKVPPANAPHTHTQNIGRPWPPPSSLRSVVHRRFTTAPNTSNSTSINHHGHLTLSIAVRNSSLRRERHSKYCSSNNILDNN